MAIPVTVLFGNPPQDIDLSASNEILDDTVVAALTFLATMAVTSRLVIKKRKYGRLQADDWFILLALEIQSIGEHKFEIGVLAEDKYVPSLHSQAALTSGSCIATITSTCYSQLRKVVDQCNTASVYGKQGGVYHNQCAEWYLLSL
ncbi:hypothetical protein D6C88_08452 [Aureobasidium pullulans]|nr:hypothetical protein D6C88_08452 [Aureobasidium pullulans]